MSDAEAMQLARIANHLERMESNFEAMAAALSVFVIVFSLTVLGLLLLRFL